MRIRKESFKKKLRGNLHCTYPGELKAQASLSYVSYRSRQSKFQSLDFVTFDSS